MTAAPPPWRIAFDNARDPYTARNVLGIGSGSGGPTPGGAPDDAGYIVDAPHADLTAERVLTDTATIAWDFSVPGQAKANSIAGGGNVSNSGTPATGQYARWVSATVIQGVAPATVLADIGAQPAGSYQPLDPDLTAIAALTGVNTIYYRSAANTWTPVVMGGHMTFAGGTLEAVGFGDVSKVGTPTSGQYGRWTGANTIEGVAPSTVLSDIGAQPAGSYQPLDADLTAIAALAGTNTIYYRSAANTWTAVTIGASLSFSGGTLDAVAQAPVGAEYITAAAHAGLSAERVLTNTASITWDFSTPGQAKASTAAGGGNVSNSGTPAAGQYGRWVTSTTIEGVAPATILADTQTPIDCGRLTYVSATALKFSPFNGDRIKIAGVVYAIPSAGIAGLANTGIFKEGVGGSSLTASLLYYVYAFNNGGTITADFSTSAHSTDSAAGNVGVEIKTGTPSRTLIGMVFTNASGQFQNTAALRCVISWFNRRPIAVEGASTAGATTASATAVEIGAGAARASFLTWGDVAVRAGINGTRSSTAAGAVVATHLYLNTATMTVQKASDMIPVANYFLSTSINTSIVPSEGLNYVVPFGETSAGTSTWYVWANAMIWG